MELFQTSLNQQQFSECCQKEQNSLDPRPFEFEKKPTKLSGLFKNDFSVEQLLWFFN